MAVVPENDTQSTKSLLAAHSRKFAARMTILLILCFVGIAVVAFFLLRGQGKVASPARSQESGKSSSTLSPEQGVDGGLSVESSSAASTDQADGSSQVALQNSVSVSTSPSTSGDVQHAATVGGSTSGDNGTGQGGTGSSDGGSVHSPVATDPIIISPPIIKPPVGCAPCGSPVVLKGGVSQHIMCPDYCMQIE